MAEMYWQALARDVPFATYATDPTVAKAAADLSRLSDFRGPKATGRSPRAPLFRVGLAGESNGPYLSQFLWQPVPYGAHDHRPAVPRGPPQGLHDHLRRLADGTAAAATPRPYRCLAPRRHPTRYMMAGRDLATFLHADFIYQAYLNAGLILLQAGRAGRRAIPTCSPRHQAGVGTFGPHYLLDLVAKVANAAVKASWYQKWVVHRRVRPEEFGGRVYHHKAGAADYPHPCRPALHIRRAGRRLPEATAATCCPCAYPEGCPVHPSYPAAPPGDHRGLRDVLKAFFDEAAVLPTPVMASADGSTLVPYTGAPLTVGGELNKLAGNLLVGRSFGGVHWRSDNMAGCGWARPWPWASWPTSAAPSTRRSVASR